VKALLPQGLTGSPNYFGLLNNLVTLIICESLREIGEMACVTPAWSSRGQTLKTPDKDYLSTIVFVKLTLFFKKWLGKLWGLFMLGVIRGDMTWKT